jgi:steroid delta-isomerase-like uncharacterized protein
MEFLQLNSAEAVPYLGALAELRIRVFREWPYLYDGSFEYEESYLQTYLKSSRSIIILAKDGDEIVGASTALPLVDADAEMQKPFVESGMELANRFYFGESVLLPQYRNRGIGSLFFDLREEWALRFPDITETVFCGVVRENKDSRRPDLYVGPERLWAKRGYDQDSNLRSKYSWPDIGDKVETEKPMQFWRRTWDKRQIAESLVRSYYRAFNDKAPERMLALLTEDVVHDVNQGPRESGKTAFAEFLSSMDSHYREHLKDFSIVANADGTRASAEFVCTGEYMATSLGLPQAHRQKYEIPVGAFFALRDRRIARVTNYYNLKAWKEQVSR